MVPLIQIHPGYGKVSDDREMTKKEMTIPEKSSYRIAYAAEY